jgi:hypothetical protein
MKDVLLPAARMHAHRLGDDVFKLRTRTQLIKPNYRAYWACMNCKKKLHVTEAAQPSAMLVGCLRAVLTKHPCFQSVTFCVRYSCISLVYFNLTREWCLQCTCIQCLVYAYPRKHVRFNYAYLIEHTNTRILWYTPFAHLALRHV